MDKSKIIRLLIFCLILLLTIFLVTSTFSPIFIKGIGCLMGLLSLLWMVSLLIKDASIIDIFWGFGFVAIAYLYALLNGWETMTIRQQVFLGMVTLWGFRLAGYLAVRNLGHGEDYRYVQMRKRGGTNWWWQSYINVFMMQGFLIWIISASYAATFASDQISLGAFDYLGIILWAIGLFFEVVGDWQMRRFKQNAANKGKVMDKGLWRYTRHPNYFGDALLWWGFFCFGLAHPQGWLFIFCPIIMTFFLLKVSGVAMLERGLKKTKPQYREYIEKTSSFIPMLPKSL